MRHAAERILFVSLKSMCRRVETTGYRSGKDNPFPTSLPNRHNSLGHDQRTKEGNVTMPTEQGINQKPRESCWYKSDSQNLTAIQNQTTISTSYIIQSKHTSRSTTLCMVERSEVLRQYQGSRSFIVSMRCIIRRVIALVYEVRLDVLKQLPVFP